MIVRERTDLSGMHCSATFSDCEAYRYLLTWRWSDQPLLIAWMLNPSTATHEQLDPTISGLVKRARAWGMGGVRVINLFALRATDPLLMKRAADPIGPDNDRVIGEVLSAARADAYQVICGWGEHGAHRGRDREALDLATRAGVQLLCLAINQGGAPRHPLYIAHDITPRPWAPAGGLAT